jgi:serine/threonine protein kinase
MSSLDELRQAGIISREDPDDVFELVEIIASGAYGSVYKGVDLKTSRELAVKIIAIEEDAALKDMMAEVSVFHKCSPHANVVEFVGCFEKEDELYIAMQFCAGGSSADVYSALEVRWREI